MSLAMKIFSMVAAVFIGVIALIGVSLWAKHEVSDVMNQIGTVTLPAVRDMTLVDMLHDGIRADVYEALLGEKEHNADQIKDAEDNLKQMSTDIARYLNETKEIGVDPEITAQILKVQPVVIQYSAQAAKVIALLSAGKSVEAQDALKEFVVLFEALEKDLGSLGEMVENVAKGNVDKSVQLAKSTTWLMLGAGAAFLMVLGFAGFVFSRNLNKSISESVHEMDAVRHQLVGASGDVNSQGQALAQGASEQAASLQETAAAIEESNAAAKHIADNSRQAAALSQEVVQVCQEGVGSMQQMNDAISSMQAAAHETANIIKIIDEIAFQTNLLALNAAVEAARAGEAGKGFAVVAEEVRNLAQRSSAAAKDTTEKIHRSLALSDQGASLSKQTAELLVAIKARAEKAKSIVEEISSSTAEQSTGMDQVNSAIVQLDKVTQLNAASAEELAAAGNEVDTQVRLLSGAIDNLEAMLSGKALPQSASVGSSPKTVVSHGVKKSLNGNHANGHTNAEVASASVIPTKAPTAAKSKSDERPSQIIPLDDQDFAGF